MIYGIGTDLVEIERVRRMHARHGDRLARRMLAPDEWDGYLASSDPVRLLAKRFAVKEAFAKAAGTGVRHPVSLTQIGVGHDPLGKPVLSYGAELAAWLAERGIVRGHLSISDEHSVCTAFVVLETE